MGVTLVSILGFVFCVFIYSFLDEMKQQTASVIFKEDFLLFTLSQKREQAQMRTSAFLMFGWTFCSKLY